MEAGGRRGILIRDSIELNVFARDLSDHEMRISNDAVAKTFWETPYTAAWNCHASGVQTPQYSHYSILIAHSP